MDTYYSVKQYQTIILNYNTYQFDPKNKLVTNILPGASFSDVRNVGKLVSYNIKTKELSYNIQILNYQI